ncbi:hypothetical protein OS493_028435 [Desmophyllum pertusum]|uniref:Uncharacterized protein n=1 Tax=Desmophyllum pertusum TaxID=174260 RepID=A0A9W9ZKL2_9CNID|nr:hypothetical protein OS493_028435 [Desmophyllum pertusum]
MKSSAAVRSIDEAPGENNSYWVHSGSSLQADSEVHSEADDELRERHEEFQYLDEKPTESKKHKNRRAGVFSQLRRRLAALRSPHLFHADDAVEMGRDDLIIVQKKRMSSYRCVPNPPGCIPTEVMLKVHKTEEERQACHSASFNRCGSMGEIPTDIDGIKNTQKVNQQDRNRSRGVNIREKRSPSLKCSKW